MFKPINYKDIEKKEKNKLTEKKQLQKIYEYALNNENYELLDDHEVKYNLDLLDTMKKYLFYHKLRKMPYEELKKVGKLDCSLHLNFILETALDNFDYIRAGRIIYYCETNGYLGVKFYNLRNRFFKERKVVLKKMPSLKEINN